MADEKTQAKIERDRKISRKSSKQKKTNGIGQKFSVAKDVAQEYAETTLVVIYIVNGVLASAILFDIVQAPQKVRYMVAAFAIAYSAIGFLMFINRGIKHQIAERKSKSQ